MKLIKFIIFLSFCVNIYSAHAGITGTPTPKSTKKVDTDSQKNIDTKDTEEKNKSDDKY